MSEQSTENDAPSCDWCPFDTVAECPGPPCRDVRERVTPPVGQHEPYGIESGYACTCDNWAGSTLAMFVKHADRPIPPAMPPSKTGV